GFRLPNVISDPTGHLTELQEAVSRDFARRHWVLKRCEQARNKVAAGIDGLDASRPFHEQVLSWLFPTGVTTHVLLVAGLRNPTVRQRYTAVRALLAQYGHLEIYEPLLALLGCAGMTRTRVEYQLGVIAEVFDAATLVLRTPFPFASDLSEIARPIAIDGSRDLIERGYHREAVFWIAVTYSRCQQVFHSDAPAGSRDRYTPGYRQLLGDLGIVSFDDLLRRGAEVKAYLPRVWETAEAIVAANPEITN
ncbi:MAG: hypothetical protein M3281_07840, partial [Chloroflexota bacterium]|nr:hypothetical protein [Chloroflexota bacterium]